MNTEILREKAKHLFRDLRKEGWVCKMGFACGQVSSWTGLVFQNSRIGEFLSENPDLCAFTVDYPFRRIMVEDKVETQLQLNYRATSEKDIKTLRKIIEDWDLRISQTFVHPATQSFVFVLANVEKQ